MPLTRFTLRQLEAFDAVADLHGFSAAAERLGLSAQAVSQLVAELEAVLGFRLFDRTTRRVSLSSAGRDFAASAQTVLRHAAAAETAAADVRNRAAGSVRVGAPLVLAATALPAAIKAYAALRPKVAVRIRDMPVERLVDAVAAGDVDLGLGPDRATGSDVAAEDLFDSPWVLWCAPTHPLARLRQVRWRELAEHPLVAAGRDHERNVAQMRANAPEESRITPVDIVDNISTALGIAAQGLAATLAPAYVGVLAQTLGLEMRRVIDPETVRKVCLYRPLGRTLSPAAEGFAEHLALWVAGWGKAKPSARSAQRRRAII
ncbi:LysR family transcriptional regulator [Aquincola sp. S2]|uniref:LysR family transcriptional regulator n=1 Tax=Pseudaquabacterium terrae TaxID=2732868 RepID=A0ABX2EAX7_9BURK|nr:LysR family transcriptional regulator [Aquabacterium terrae]NRF65487.1 LysR family transcriptional regulator [Aquabacterium terrae]